MVIIRIEHLNGEAKVFFANLHRLVSCGFFHQAQSAQFATKRCIGVRGGLNDNVFEVKHAQKYLPPYFPGPFEGAQRDGPW